MWIGSVRLDTPTAAVPDGDNLVVAYLIRDGVPLTAVDLALKETPRGRAYVASMLGQVRATPGTLAGREADLPEYGLEFASGIARHLTMRVVVYGDDGWVADGVRLSVRELRRTVNRWVEDEEWTEVARWSADDALGRTRGPGARTWTFGV